MKTIIALIVLLTSVRTFAAETLDFYLDCGDASACIELPARESAISVQNKPSLSFGEQDILSMKAWENQYGDPALSVQLKPPAGVALSELTKANLQRHLAIVFQGRVLTNPLIHEAIGDNFQI